MRQQIKWGWLYVPMFIFTSLDIMKDDENQHFIIWRMHLRKAVLCFRFSIHYGRPVTRLAPLVI